MDSWADEAPGGFRLRALAVTHARIVNPGQPVIEQGTILIRDGRIVAVGAEIPIPVDAEELNIQGLTVYPGFIDAGATRLLDPHAQPVVPEYREEERSRTALAAMRTVSRPGITPEFDAAEHLKPPADELERYRQSGFTAVHVIPTGRTVSGRSAVVHTSTAPVRDTTVATPGVMAFQLVDRHVGEYPSTLMGVMAQLRQAFLDASRRIKQFQLAAQPGSAIAKPNDDPLLDALASVCQQKTRSLWTVHSRDDHERTLRFALEFQLKPILWGGRQAHEWLPDLQSDSKDLILQVDFGDEPAVAATTPTETSLTAVKDVPEPQRVREFRHEEWKRRVAAARDLKQAGWRLAFSSHGVNAPADMLKGVRQTIQAGLTPDAALAALTCDAAALMGLSDQLGRIEPGKLACLTVMTGPLENSEALVRYVILPDKRYEYHRDAQPLPAAPASAAPAPVLIGKWNLTIQHPDGQLAGELAIEQQDRKLLGKFSSEAGNGRITSGDVSAEGFQFTVAIGAGDKAIELKFSGKLEADKLVGAVKSPFGAATNWTATRHAEPMASASPIQLSGVETETTPEKTSDFPTELDSDRRARKTPPPAAVTLVRNGTILTGTGQTLPVTSLLIRHGMISAIGPEVELWESIVADALHPGEPTIIDASDRFVMPGIIDTHSHIMIGSSTGLGGVNEYTDSIVAEVRIKDVINTADPAEYRALAAGVTTARLLHGSANVIGGQDAVVQLKHGRSAAEHLVSTGPQGIKFALGENVKARTGRFPNTRLGVEATLQRAFVEALEYRRGWQEFEKKCREVGAEAAGLPPRRDLRLEALAGILDHEVLIHSHCYRADEILMLLRVADRHGFKVRSLQHVLEGYKVAPEIVAHGASCSTFADWWAYKVEAYDATPANAALLHAAGANTVIKSDDHELIRHLPLEAAKTIRYGSLPAEAALQTVTLNAARELGLDDRIGSIEIGKQADLAIFNGHPLSPYSRCEMTLIAGSVEFIREHQPSAMSDDAAARSRTAPPLELPPRTPETQAEFLRSSRLLEVAAQPRYALTNATLHPIDAADIANGTLLVEEGRIHSLGPNLAVPEGVPTISLSGLHVYPGLIDAGTTLGLVEIGKVRETHDYAEGGPFQPDLQAGIAINPDSELIPAARAGGITTIHIRPIGGTIAGQTSLARLAGWTVPDMLLEPSAALQINWPGGPARQAAIDELRQFIKEARIYDRIRQAQEKSTAEAGAPVLDPRYEALRAFLRGERPVHIEADSRQQILEAVQFAQEESLKLVLSGASDAWKTASLLKERNVPVIVGPVMRQPVEPYDPIDATYANPGRLWEAGVKFCIRSNNASNSRNAPFEAAVSVAYGLPETEALRSVTLSAAEILGIADEVGSLTPGKRADLIITDGSPLVITSQIRGVLLGGKPFAPESRQTRLAEKYRQRISGAAKPTQ